MRILTILLALIAAPVAAQDRLPSHCIALSQSAPGLTYIHRAAFIDAVPVEQVRISYLDHSMFLIQAHDGTNALTDFTGYFGNVDMIPDVVTMNNAHSSHWTRFPDPAIPHILEGWANADGRRDYYVELGDMLVRNVHTDTRDQFNGGATPDGNSIFVFEAAGLCIGHLGHLHQEPSIHQYAALGRMDVVMAAVDGGLTLDHATLVRVLDRMRSSVVIPMHWFGRGTLDLFLDDMRESGYRVEMTGETSMMMSRDALPSERTVMVLEPRLLTAE